MFLFSILFFFCFFFIVGVVLAVCFAARPYKENISKWLNFLQTENTNLKNMNIVINMVDDADETDGEKPVISAQ